MKNANIARITQCCERYGRTGVLMTSHLQSAKSVLVITASDLGNQGRYLSKANVRCHGGLDPSLSYLRSPFPTCRLWVVCWAQDSHQGASSWYSMQPPYLRQRLSRGLMRLRCENDLCWPHLILVITGQGILDTKVSEMSKKIQ